MSQKNQIYYTTAQVTDMVELSDQNVRKYVRMLEERGYEVAKDEHQRRLFSQNDVHILNEMIRISKTPGFTLELAADEIMKTMDEIIASNEVASSDDSNTNENVLRALEKVLQKLEEMRQENIVLRENVTRLVTRLEEYDQHILEVGKEQKLLATEVEEMKENTDVVENNEKETPVEEPVEAPEEPKETEEVKEDEAVAETISENIEPEKSNNVDMRDFGDPVEAIEVPENDNNETDASTEEETPVTDEQVEQEEQKEEQPVQQVPIKEAPKKKGFFARLFGG